MKKQFKPKRQLAESYIGVKSVTVPNVTNPPLKVLLQRMANSGETLQKLEYDVDGEPTEDYSDIYTMDATDLVMLRKDAADLVTTAKMEFHHATRALLQKQQSSKEDASPSGAAPAASGTPPKEDNPKP